MKKLKALFRKAWDLLDDDRVNLIITGAMLSLAFFDLKAGRYAWMVGDLIFAIVIGVTAWFGHSSTPREARG